MLTDSDTVLHPNNQNTLHNKRELLQCGQRDRSGEWHTVKYIQHNPNAN
jgi:predicted SnoaL-like aldol condensation-catalyzing enzyme